MNLQSGFATLAGTARYAGRFPAESDSSFYRTAQGLQVSSVGLGTYLGRTDEEASLRYREAIGTALSMGVNFLDTSLNYRNQLSERAMGDALRVAFEQGVVARDEVVVCTKAGYLVPGATPDALTPDDVVGGMHSMAPAFLADQIERSLHNLGLATVDVFYLHNPETQLNFVSRDEFYTRVRAAFEFMEKARQSGKIRYYGAATWDGFRRKPGGPEGLALGELESLARMAGGPEQGFRFVQIPFNLAMPEAFTITVNGQSVLDQAAQRGITVVASASLLQSRLARNLPDELSAKFPDMTTDAQRALQFTRSTPGITVALVGMSQIEHVRENVALALRPPLVGEAYLSIYSTV